MVNHYRTLLANLSANAEDIGEEYIPEDFSPVTSLPPFVKAAREVIFGPSPDRAMVNYRCFQVLSIVRNSRFSSWLTKFDKRTTYHFDDGSLFDSRNFGHFMSPQPLTVVKISSVKQGISDHDKWIYQLRYKYLVDVSGLNTVSIYQQRGSTTQIITSETLHFNDGLSQPIHLPASFYTIRFQPPVLVGDHFSVDILMRPNWSIEKSLELKSSAASILFEHVSKALKDVWYNKNSTTIDKIAALATAVVEKTEECRCLPP